MHNKPFVADVPFLLGGSPLLLFSDSSSFLSAAVAATAISALFFSPPPTPYCLLRWAHSRSTTNSSPLLLLSAV